MSLVADLRKQLQARKAEIETEIGPKMTELAEIESALVNLGGATKRGPTSAGRTTPSGRAPRGQRRAQVLEFVEKNPNSKPSEIARGIDTSSNQVSGLLRKLRNEKLIRRTSGGGYSLSASGKAASDGLGAS